MFRDIGPVEIGIVLLIILIVFGAGKLPQVGNAVGKSIREFRRASHGEDEEDKKETTAKSDVQSDDKPLKN